MNLRTSILTIMIIIVIFTSAGCKNMNTSSISLNTPDKINMYANGKQQQATKGGSKLEQTLYNRIDTLINVRMPQQFSVMEGFITDKEIATAKEFAVEFIYNKPQTFTIYNGRNDKIQFTEILFPLGGGKFENMALIKTSDTHYTGVGIKENLDYLVKASLK